MNFCLVNHQEKAYLQQAQEIKVYYKDRKGIPDIHEEYPTATIILQIPPNVMDYDLNEIKDYKILTHNQLIVCLPNINHTEIAWFQEQEIPYYWGFQINTAYELNALATLKPRFVRVGAPLFFDQKTIAAAGIPVRATPNIAHYGYFPYKDGVNGTWIRPEDLDKYTTIESVEFEDCDLAKERALFRIYAIQKQYPGDLAHVVSNLGDQHPTNRMIPPECVEARLNCRQRCESGSPCRLCWRYFSLANPELMAYLVESKNKD